MLRYFPDNGINDRLIKRHLVID